MCARMSWLTLLSGPKCVVTEVWPRCPRRVYGVAFHELARVHHVTPAPPPLVTKHTGRPRRIGRHTSDLVTKHAGHFLKDIGHWSPSTRDNHGLGHQTHGTLRPRHVGHWSPNTRDITATHRPPTHLVLGHQTHRTIRPRHTSDTSATPRSTHTSDTSAIPLSTTSLGHIGHTSAATHLRHTLVTTHFGYTGHTSASHTCTTSRSRHIGVAEVLRCVVAEAGPFSQDTSAISHQAHGTLPEGATHRPPTHLGLGH